MTRPLSILETNCNAQEEDEPARIILQTWRYEAELRQTAFPRSSKMILFSRVCGSFMEYFSRKASACPMSFARDDRPDQDWRKRALIAAGRKSLSIIQHHFVW